MALHGRVEATRLQSRLLGNNPLNDPHVRDVLVYVPPGYDDEPAARYPVVVVLPGFGSTHRSLLRYEPWRPNPVERFDRLVAAGACRPALLVLPDALTRWGGSQFVDSPATAPYQSYIADEVLPHVDATYRTLGRREGRAVVGTSSGGFGALRLAMDRPDRVAAVGSHAGDAAFDISMRPLLTPAAITFETAGGVGAFARAIDERGPQSGREFESLMVLALAAAYAPDERGPFPYAALPFEPRTAELRPDVWQRWLAHDPLHRLQQHETVLRDMRLVYLDAGNRDEHGLHFAARLLAEPLRRANVAIRHEEFEGGHRGTGWRYEVSLPALVDTLDTA